ncbi:uncharacterized protein PG986_010517 [Apiospora aurea]|uniref:Uncharacterized protein n=1 Tax=Apiospora aurea TaxID=335848 RepID=A0ABR1Q2X3_9PEZI
MISGDVEDTLGQAILARRGLERVFRLNGTLGASLDRGLVDRRDTRSPEFSIFDGGDLGHTVNGSLAWLLCSKRRFPSWESTEGLNPPDQQTGHWGWPIPRLRPCVPPLL